jgi:hypothetical protein
MPSRAPSGGNFVVKIFQGGDQQAFLKKMRELFTSAKGFKPEACRTESFETYLVGLGKKVKFGIHFIEERTKINTSLFSFGILEQP